MNSSVANSSVDIHFDCLPLRAVGTLEVSPEASPKFRERFEKIRRALETHGAHNTYYLYNASCVFHLTNAPDLGMLQFSFEGTAFTDATDARTERCDLDVRLERETCDWLTEPIVAWFCATVPHAVTVQFDRYIAAGDLRRTVERIARLQAETDTQGGFMGMYL